MTQQETAKDIGARVTAAIEQGQIATREAERRAAQWEDQCKQLRAALDSAERRADKLSQALAVAEEERDEYQASAQLAGQTFKAHGETIRALRARIRELARGEGRGDGD